jgi:hypothetical protein
VTQELSKIMPKTMSPVVEILPVQLILEFIPALSSIPPDGQSVAKLLKLKSMARQNKKHWDKLKNFLI